MKKLFLSVLLVNNLLHGLSRELVDKILFSASEGDCSQLSALVVNTEKANCANESGMTPLLVATQCNHPKAVSFLLSKGARHSTKEKNGFSALFLAAQKNHYEVGKILIAAGAQSDEILDDISLLMICGVNNSHEMAQLLLQSGAQVSFSHQQQGETALTLACSCNKPSMARLFLEHGAPPDQVTNAGETALLIASRNGFVECVEILHEYKADLNYVSPQGMTAVLAANAAGHKDLVRFLLRNGARLTMKYCQSCKKTQNLQTCSGCQKVYYCSRDCQKAAWTEHKALCKKVDRIKDGTTE